MANLVKSKQYNKMSKNAKNMKFLSKEASLLKQLFLRPPSSSPIQSVKKKSFMNNKSLSPKSFDSVEDLNMDRINPGVYKREPSSNLENLFIKMKQR